jgi:hypothetical protein
MDITIKNTFDSILRNELKLSELNNIDFNEIVEYFGGLPEEERMYCMTSLIDIATDEELATDAYRKLFKGTKESMETLNLILKA